MTMMVANHTMIYRKPGCFMFTIGLVLQLILFVVVFVLAWLTFVYFTPGRYSLHDNKHFAARDW
jgi:hypothetical protein